MKPGNQRNKKKYVHGANSGSACQYKQAQDKGTC
jgi:hypothetical protein